MKKGYEELVESIKFNKRCFERMLEKLAEEDNSNERMMYTFSDMRRNVNTMVVEVLQSILEEAGE